MSLSQIFIALLAGGMIALAVLGIRLLWLLWLMHRELRRVERLSCPACNYPLRFDGTQYWCSECGYKHSLRR